MNEGLITGTGAFFSMMTPAKPEMPGNADSAFITLLAAQLNQGANLSGENISLPSTGMTILPPAPPPQQASELQAFETVTSFIVPGPHPSLSPNSEQEAVADQSADTQEDAPAAPQKAVEMAVRNGVTTQIAVQNTGFPPTDTSRTEFDPSPNSSPNPEQDAVEDQGKHDLDNATVLSVPSPPQLPLPILSEGENKVNNDHYSVLSGFGEGLGMKAGVRTYGHIMNSSRLTAHTVAAGTDATPEPSTTIPVMVEERTTPQSITTLALPASRRATSMAMTVDTPISQQPPSLINPPMGTRPFPLEDGMPSQEQKSLTPQFNTPEAELSFRTTDITAVKPSESVFAHEVMPVIPPIALERDLPEPILIPVAPGSALTPTPLPNLGEEPLRVKVNTIGITQMPQEVPLTFPWEMQSTQEAPALRLAGIPPSSATVHEPATSPSQADDAAPEGATTSAVQSIQVNDGIDSAKANEPLSYQISKTVERAGPSITPNQTPPFDQVTPTFPWEPLSPQPTAVNPHVAPEIAVKITQDLTVDSSAHELLTIMNIQERKPEVSDLMTPIVPQAPVAVKEPSQPLILPILSPVTANTRQSTETKEQHEESTPVIDGAVSSRMMAQHNRVAARPEPVPTPIAAVQLIEQIAEKIRVRTSGGERELSLRLDPPDLGMLHIKVTAQADGEIFALIETASPVVRDLLDTRMADLRQTLANAGIDVERCTVSLNMQTGQQDKQQQGQTLSQQQSPFLPGLQGNTASASPGETILRDIRHVDHWSVDYFA